MEESGPFPSTTKNTQYPWEERRREPDCHCALSSHSCTGNQAGLWLLSGEKQIQIKKKKKKMAYYASIIEYVN